MKIDADAARNLREFLGELLAPRRPVIVVGFGQALDPGQSNQKGLTIMAVGNVGQRIPLVEKFFQADGTTPATVDGTPTLTSSDPALVEIRHDDAANADFAYLLAEGSATITLSVDADRTAGIRELTAIGLIVVNDPATEAQIVELDLGPAEDVPVT